MSEKREAHSNASAVSPDGAVSKNRSTAVIPLLIAVLISVVLNGWFSWNSLRQDADTSPPVLVIDPYALQHAKKEQLLAAGMTDFEKIVTETEKFALLLDAVLNDYREAGFVVVNRNAVIAAPERLDITETVAQRLKLSLAPR